MPDKKLLRELAKTEAYQSIIQHKKELLSEVIKIQEKLETQQNNLDIVLKYEQLLNNQLEEKYIADVITNILDNNKNFTLVCATLCSGCEIPEHLMDRMIKEIVAANKFDIIKTVLIARDDLPEDYKDKLESYLVAHELSKKPSRYDD